MIYKLYKPKIFKSDLYGAWMVQLNILFYRFPTWNEARNFACRQGLQNSVNT